MRIPLTMAKNDLGKTIIDELKLCYEAEQMLLDDLSKVEIGGWVNLAEFALFRVVSRHFQYGFDVMYKSGHGDRVKVATLRFAHYGEQEHSSYVYYRVENTVLYDAELLNVTMSLADMLGLVFCHITSIDLARDYKFNVVQRIRKVAKDDAVTVIVNGKAIDKKKDIGGAMLVYSLNFHRLKNPTIAVKQAKAVKDKTKGLTMCAYDKGNEIDKASGKDYIREFYGNPKVLHRLEVHLNNQEIKDYCRNVVNIVQDMALLSDHDFLDAMYDYHLSALLRFTRGRKKLDWNEILCNRRI